jgi:hypothetical protein
VRQLKKIRLRAAEVPGTIPVVVRAQIEAEAKRAATQDGFTFTMRREGKEINPKRSSTMASDWPKRLASNTVSFKAITARTNWLMRSCDSGPSPMG